ncbi:MAG TPA: bZIP transcription factor, partial [Methylomirabilota bacterium]|nr:bZIP transcription factor [Methylomirabilota bacterium]
KVTPPAASLSDFEIRDGFKRTHNSFSLLEKMLYQMDTEITVRDNAQKAETNKLEQKVHDLQTRVDELEHEVYELQGIVYSITNGVYGHPYNKDIHVW